ncbi:crotonase/enoyl-CoA hydratase family protein [Mycobacterium sp. Aquia_216]|uniref:crotonase/enoyl-CoA hydratase family protein n=1 Tax=Mycobacterium sp. Aquia_216 TaxID=2991729 RepID=UPI00227A4FC6|nr:crotonase/enoyl-CoA hydratase family protein [Mycobacterium sp. Aquia_216]WAJ45328.1 crotonase/enoyl-CoA hydratase family protein [Mycobacterium sp. Aquia_216]
MNAIEAPPVLVERRDRVLVIALNRPDARNAINSAMTTILIDAIRALDSDAGLSVGVITGSGKGFCSGMDLKEFASQGTPKGLDMLLREGARKPLIAAVDGFCLAGGLELALICDIVVASERSRFGIPETQVGLFAAGGGVIRLPRRMPYGAAARMAFSAQPIGAEEAARIGLVTQLVADGEVVAEALKLADNIARNAPLALAASKAVLQAAAGGLTEDDLWTMQLPLIKQVFKSQDAKEGPRSFAEKRAPVWQGV